MDTEKDYNQMAIKREERLLYEAREERKKTPGTIEYFLDNATQEELDAYWAELDTKEEIRKKIQGKLDELTQLVNGNIDALDNNAKKSLGMHLYELSTRLMYAKDVTTNNS